MAIDRYSSNDVGPPVASTAITYLVWFFLGNLGGHRFLTGRVGTGMIMLLLHGLGWLTWWFGLGFLIWGFVGVWWLIDALLIPGWLRR
jgi:TM2 domain-containing membrane protein YozV